MRPNCLSTRAYAAWIRWRQRHLDGPLPPPFGDPDNFEIVQCRRPGGADCSTSRIDSEGLSRAGLHPRYIRCPALSRIPICRAPSAKDFRRSVLPERPAMPISSWLVTIPGTQGRDRGELELLDTGAYRDLHIVAAGLCKPGSGEQGHSNTAVVVSNHIEENIVEAVDVCNRNDRSRDDQSQKYQDESHQLPDCAMVHLYVPDHEGL